jgi:N-acetylmuramoyl-L-alanine amidase
VNIYGQHPVSGGPDQLKISGLDWRRVIAPLLSPPVIPPLRCVCIDPGHGGSDPGSQMQRHGLVEKQLTLDVARRLRTLLEAKNIRVVLTREEDNFIALANRPSIANRSGCDLLLSIHFNAADGSGAEGVETYILPSQGTASTARLQNLSAKDREFFPNNRHDGKNLHLGYCLQRELGTLQLSKDRGLRRGRFLILENANCAAALVECGFLTGASEGQRIGNPQHRQAIAQALCRGICVYGNCR